MFTEYKDLIDNLLAIIVIDLVLAGDNAILIALATQNLSKPLQRKAILWGSIGAIVIRTIMTFSAIYLLQIPGLLGVGGVALLIIAYKLLTDQNEDKNHSPSSTHFWAAMKTIVIADTVMGIDNVLAVAGASNGNLGLVIAGLLISIPIVVFGSQMVLSLLTRFSWIIYVGSTVLVLTGCQMIIQEPLLDYWFGQHTPQLYEIILIAVCMCLVLGLGWISRRKSYELI